MNTINFILVCDLQSPPRKCWYGNFRNTAPDVVRQYLQDNDDTVRSDGTGGPDGNTENVLITTGKQTLFGIARDQLNQASRYVEILELNRAVLPSNATPSMPIAAGTRLVLRKTKFGYLVQFILACPLKLLLRHHIQKT